MATARLHFQSSPCGHGAQNRHLARRLNLSTRCSANSADIALPSRREIVTQSASLLAGAALLPSCAPITLVPSLVEANTLGCFFTEPKAYPLKPALKKKHALSSCSLYKFLKLLLVSAHIIIFCLKQGRGQQRMEAPFTISLQLNMGKRPALTDSRPSHRCAQRCKRMTPAERQLSWAEVIPRCHISPPVFASHFPITSEI